MAAAFTALFGVYVVAGPGGGVASSGMSRWRSSPPSPTPPPPDPASEARLAAYETAYRSAASETKPGLRCEQVATAFERLNPSDVALGRSVLSSTTARIKALADGQSCRENIVSSDGRFDQIYQIVEQDGDEASKGSCGEIVIAFGRLGVFDRSRARYDDDADRISTARALSEKCQASDSRLAVLTGAAAKLRIDPGAGSLVHAADAARSLTDFDRDRASPKQKLLISKADKAADAVADSHSRIAQLSNLLSTNSVQADADSTENLFRATQAISKFDEEVASPAEAAVIYQARDKTASLAWTSLRTRLAALDRNPNQPGSYPPAIETYNVASHDGRPLTDDQRRLLARGAAAAQVLAASDARLQSLIDAANAWRERGIAARSVVSDTKAALTSFDVKRFDEAHQHAFDILGQADSVIHGPTLGLRSAGQSRTLLFVIPDSRSGWNVPVAKALEQKLQAEGFAISATRDAAALLLRVSVESLSDPELVVDDSQMAHQASDAQVRIVGRWVADDSLLVDEAVNGSGSGDAAYVQRQALRDAVDKAAGDIKKLASTK